MMFDVLVQSRRDKRAAKRLLPKLLKRQCRAPRVMITDKLPSYGAAKREVMPGVEHRQHKGMNNRSEEHTSELQSRQYLVCRLLLEKKKIITSVTEDFKTLIFFFNLLFVI